jgi:hypothetical protein
MVKFFLPDAVGAAWRAEILPGANHDAGGARARLRPRQAVSVKFEPNADLSHLMKIRGAFASILAKNVGSIPTTASRPSAMV